MSELSDHLSKDEILNRIKMSRKMMEKFVSVDEDACRRFLDPSVAPAFTMTSGGEPVDINDPEVTTEVPIGVTNRLTAMELVKLAVVSINHPDWYITAEKPEVDPQSSQPTGKMVSDPDSAKVWRQFLRDEWDRKNWQPVAQKTLLKRYVAGLGCTRWGYAADGGVYWEHVQSWDYGVDPYVRDWQKPDYGHCRIRMSLRTADKRYPKGPFKKKMGDSAMAKVKGDATKIEIDLYWDDETEAHIYEKEWLIPASVEKNPDSKSNLYNRVPLLFLEGDIQPGKSPFPLGDSILAAASQAQLSDLDTSMTRTAKAGVGFTVLDVGSGGFNEAQLESLQEGKHQQYIGLSTFDYDRPPWKREPGEELRPAVLEVYRKAEDDMMGLVGISGSDLGVYSNKPEFATQVAVTQQKGGARQNHARSEYETFLNRFAARHLWLFKEFGEPNKNDKGEYVSSDEHVTLWDIANRITEIKVIEGSTSYKDPSFQQQQTMQKVSLMMQNLPIMVSAASMGLTGGMMFNIKKAWDDLFRAFDVTNVEQMWIPFQQQQQPEHGKPEKPLVPYNENTPDDVKRQMEARDGYHPSQILPAPDHGPAVDLETQARDHLHEAGMMMEKHRHERDMSALSQLAAAKNGAQKGSK